MAPHGSDDEDEERLQEVNFMTVENMKDFLRKRCWPTSGLKENLKARVLMCLERKVEVQIEGVEAVRQRNDEYKKILLDLNVPDPLSLVTGWCGEHNGGRTNWPDSLDHDNVIDYLGDESGSLNRYKTDKAFQYTHSGWCKNVYYHPLTDDRRHCILYNQCTPSMSIQSPPHEAWIAVDKDTGAIDGGYCSCKAG